MQILVVIIYLHWNRKIVSTVNLGPTCETRRELMDTEFCPKSYEVILIKEGRTWADKTEVSFQDAVNLW